MLRRIVCHVAQLATLYRRPRRTCRRNGEPKRPPRLAHVRTQHTLHVVTCPCSTPSMSSRAHALVSSHHYASAFNVELSIADHSLPIARSHLNTCLPVRRLDEYRIKRGRTRPPCSSIWTDSTQPNAYASVWQS